MAINNQVLIVGGKQYVMDVKPDGKVEVVERTATSINPLKPTG